MDTNNIEQLICSMLIQDRLDFNTYKLKKEMFMIESYNKYIHFLSHNNGRKTQKELNQIYLSKAHNVNNIFINQNDIDKKLEVFNVRTLIELLYKYTLRNVIQYKLNLINESKTDKTGLEEIEAILEEISQLIKDLSSKEIELKSPTDKYRDYMAKTLVQQEENYFDTNLVGVSSGLIELDRLTKGFKEAEYIIIAARPSMGKTALLLDIITESIMKGNNCLVHSLEMPTQQLVARILPKINPKLSINNSLFLEDYELKKEEINKALQVIDNSNLHIEDYENNGGAITMSDIEKVTDKYLENNDHIDIVGLDYIQLMGSDLDLKNSNENAQMTNISIRIKNLCKKTKSPWLVLSQLNRGLESRSDKRPLNSDLRSSGSLEQDADLILFPFRENVYLEREIKEKLSRKPDNIELQEALENISYSEIENAEIIVSKNRNGPIGILNMQFHKKSASYINIGDRQNIDNYSELNEEVTSDYFQ